MKFSVSQYQTLSERFNKMNFLQKVLTVKQQDIFILESDMYGNLNLRLDDFEAMNLELDLLFTFPQQLNGRELKVIFDLGGINLKTV